MAFRLLFTSRSILITLLWIPASISMAFDAFPGASGFGKSATGWRGGDVVNVTTLDDDGPGSLRECAMNEGQPRICVFKVSGTIGVRSPIKVGSNLYLAGQTAPGQGVQLRLEDGSQTPILIKNSHDVLVRYLKIRPGELGVESANIDAVTIEGSTDVYLDALSMQFASDETINVHVNTRPTHDITIGRSIIALSLDDSVHPKGPHSKGALICSNEGPLDAGVACGRVTLVGNLFAHNRDRNPDLKATEIGPIDVVNNVFYNPISQFGEFYDLLGDLAVHYIGNIALAGPSTRSFLRPRAIEGFDWDEVNTLRIYEADNQNSRRHCGDVVSVDIVDRGARGFLINELTQPLSTDPIASSDVLTYVLETVGAQTAYWGRDALDQQVVNDVETCVGKVIDRPEQVGGWPDLPEESAAPDTDGDGMPDTWEQTHIGLNPNDAGDVWQDRDGDGWSNIEEYLSALAGDLDG